MCFVHSMRIAPVDGKLMRGNTRIHDRTVPYFQSSLNCAMKVEQPLVFTEHPGEIKNSFLASSLTMDPGET